MSDPTRFDPEATLPKVVVCCKRSPGTSLEEFREVHRSTVASGASQLPALVRLVESTTLASGYRGGEPLYDCIDELWFEDEGAASAARRSPELAAMTSHPGVDAGSVATITTHDRVAKDGAVPGGGVKSFEFVLHRSDLPIEAFQEYWAGVHGPLAAKIPMIRRYVQSHCLLSEYADGVQPPWDGAAITWFEDTDQMRLSARTEQLAVTRADEPNFLAPGHLPFVITTEEVLVGADSSTT